MAETLVENQVCNACGADIRKDALFCYNCGGTVASESVNPKAAETLHINPAAVKPGSIINESKTSQSKSGVTSKLPLEKPDEPVVISDVKPEAALTSAASLRKKPKNIERKQVEISWEEYKSAPNIRFIIAALLLTAFAVLVIWLGLYSR